MQKDVVLAAVVELLHTELASVVRTAQLAHDEATSDESRPENQYDTRGLEASYLAHGLTDRILNLQSLLSYFETLQAPAFGPEDEIAAGALVCYRLGRATRWCLMAPHGGVTVSVGDARVTVLSPASPLGSVLVDAVCGDVVEYDSPSGPQQVEILAVR